MWIFNCKYKFSFIATVGTPWKALKDPQGSSESSDTTTINIAKLVDLREKKHLYQIDNSDNTTKQSNTRQVTQMATDIYVSLKHDSMDCERLGPPTLFISATCQW